MKKDFEWIKMCIESCTNEWQLQTGYKLYELFIAKYGCIPYVDDLLKIYTDKKALINIQQL